MIPIPTITTEAAFPATITVPPNKLITNSKKTENLILMIREPPQTQLTSTPPIARVVQSMETSNCHQKSNLKEFVQVPKTSTKTRIFLLTRPMKPQYVTLVPKVLSKVNESNLNIKTPTTTTTTPTRTSVKINPQTKIIRIPFLSRSRMQNVLVKKTELNSLPLKKETIQTQSLTEQTEEVISHSYINQSKKDQSVITIIPSPSTINNLNYSAVNQKPLTLTSMAGKQLINADVKMSHSNAEMSGAMPPTATVEEIDVPVFIDEYIRKTSSVDNIKSTIGDNFNIFNNNTNNSYNNTNQNINIINEPCNVKGNVQNTCEIFENFDFDIDLLSEEHQHQHQYQQQQQQQQEQKQEQEEKKGLTEKSIFLTTNGGQQLPQFCMETEKDLLNELLFDTNLVSLTDQTISNNINILQFDNNNNNKNNNDSNNSCTSTTVNTAISSKKNSNDDNKNKMEANMFGDNDMNDVYDTESLFKILPSSQQYDETMLMDELLKTEENDICNEIRESTVFSNNDNDRLSVSQCFLNSQTDDILLTNFFAIEQRKPMEDEIFKAEPVTYNYNLLPDDVPMEMASDYLNSENCTPPPEQQQTFNISSNVQCSPMEIDLTSIIKEQQQPVKKKLCLDIKKISNSQDNPATTLDTPSVIEYITQDFSEATVINVQSVDTIKKQLEDSCSDFSELSDNIEDYLPPTPCSSFSATNQSTFTDEPNSPCSSSKTQTQQYHSLRTVSSTKRSRGRPAKMHSDFPDESVLRNMNKIDQQKYLDRHKNNEASRKSRLKTKERELQLIEEEKELQIKYNDLEQFLETQRKIEDKLRRALKRRHFDGHF